MKKVFALIGIAFGLLVRSVEFYDRSTQISLNGSQIHQHKNKKTQARRRYNFDKEHASSVFAPNIWDLSMCRDFSAILQARSIMTRKM